jgi:hypothetical protein
MIGCTSASAEQKKAEHVRELIDNELGITTPFNCLWSETKVKNIEKKNSILFFFLSFRHIFTLKIVQILFLVIVLLILFIE